VRSGWQTTDSSSHLRHAISLAVWRIRLRLPFAYDDPTYVNDTIRREHSPPRLGFSRL
jgi:hypothetical protein